MFLCFSFPKDVTERNKWFQSLGVEINSQRFTFLCSDHFLSSDFYTEPSGRRRLKKDAMPPHLEAVLYAQGESYILNIVSYSNM
jgi:hypothetical protein